MNNLISHNNTTNRAKELGFDLCGVVRPTHVGIESERVENWIKSGYNGGMNWFERNREIRYNPQLLSEGNISKSLVICGLGYQLSSSNDDSPVASYAHFRDYHITIKQLLERLHRAIEIDSSRQFAARYYVDSAPLLERYWAREAGFGWIGKNSMLINRKLGSMFFVGSILIEGEFDTYDSADEFDGCGECNRCRNICPNGAIGKNKTLDTNRCLSYLTIEHKPPYSDEQKSMIRRGDSKIFGCDKCVTICPWNIKSLRAITPSIETRRKELLDYRTLAKSPAELLEGVIPKDSPLKRAGRSKLREIFNIKEL